MTIPRRAFLTSGAVALVAAAPAAVAPAAPTAAPVELLADDFSKYPVAELLDSKTFGSRLGPWQLTSLHYSWRSRRYEGWRTATLPWRIVQRDDRRWLDQPEKFFNVVFKAGNPLWRDYVMELDLAVNDGPAGPLVRYKTGRQKLLDRL